MQTQTTENTNTTPPPAAANDDVIRRGIKRVLPCKLTEDEFVEIAKKRVGREALLKQCEADLAREQKKRKDQIAELEDEIGTMGRQLHTESEDRTVLCNEVFRRAENGTGYVHTIRLDTNEEVETRPATVSETQRYLPSDGFSPPANGASVLDQARTAQGATNGTTNGAAAESDEIKPDELDDDEDDADDASDEKPKRGAKGKKGK